MAWGESFLSGLADNSSLLKALGLMTAGTGAAAYAMSPDDAEAKKLDAQKIIGNIMRKHNPYDSNFYEIGLRKNTDGRPLQVGVELPRSHVWDDGNPTDELLPGSSTIGLTEKNVPDAIKRMGIYSSDDPNLYLVGGSSAMGGEDVGEMVLRDARVAGRFSPDRYNFALPLGASIAGAGAYGLMSPDDANASISSVIANDLAGDAERALARDAERGTAASSRDWAKDAGNNTPNIAQALTPNDPFSPSSSQLAATAALITALKSKDQPLEDTYQPGDLFAAFMTGGAGLAPKLASAALDPVISAGMDYAPSVLDAINPRNIVVGLMR